MPTKNVSALTDEDIRRKYYETAGYSTWITEMQLDPLQLIVCDDSTGKYFRVPVALKGGAPTFGEPVEVAIQYVKATARQALSAAIVWASAADSRNGVAPASPATGTSGGGHIDVSPEVTPAGAAIRKIAAAAAKTPPTGNPAGGSVSTEQEASGMPFDAAKLREALGLSADANADDALRAFAGALSALGGGQNPTATGTDLSATPPANGPAPVTVPQLADGNRPILLDPTQLAALQESARKGETAWAQLRRNERDGVLDEAIRLGKFPASRRDYWVQLWDRDPDGTRAAVNALATNVIPVLAPGYLGDDSASRSAADQAFEGLYGKDA